jgi:hypothetical protein
VPAALGPVGEEAVAPEAGAVAGTFGALVELGLGCGLLEHEQVTITADMAKQQRIRAAVETDMMKSSDVHLGSGPSRTDCREAPDACC